jgi:hypothetical protein
MGPFGVVDDVEPVDLLLQFGCDVGGDREPGVVVRSGSGRFAAAVSVALTPPLGPRPWRRARIA